MIYDRTERSYGDGQWHCPFSREWVERMARAAKRCERLTAAQIEVFDRRLNEGMIPVWEEGFLDGPQDARGLPLSWCREYEEIHRGWPECCTAIYDYDSIPEMVVTNGKDDWPLRLREKILTA